MYREWNHRMNFMELPDLEMKGNITFRLGARWHSKAEVDDTIALYQTGDSDDEEPYAVCKITSLRLGTFSSITIGELDHCCSLGVETPEDLAYSLLKCYPNEFNLDSDITVVEFEILAESEESEEGGG